MSINSDYPPTKEEISASLEARGFSKDFIGEHYEILGQRETKNLTGYAVNSVRFTYHDIHGIPIKNGDRVRHYFSDSQKKSAKIKKKKLPKYASLTGEPPRIYFPKMEIGGNNWEMIQGDPTIDIIITEGEFKADMGALKGFPVLSLAGVWSWRSKSHGMPVLPELASFDMTASGVRRKVYVVFDADLHSNPHVFQAMHQLSTWLTNQGAVPYIVTIPILGGDTNLGMDDYLQHMLGGVDAFTKLLASSPPFMYCEELLKLNSEVVYVEHPGIVLKVSNDAMMSPHAFSGHIYLNRYIYEINTKNVLTKSPAARAWLGWEQRSVAASCTYAPGEDKITVDNKYNMWNGWGVEPVEGDISPWNILLDFVFRGDAEARIWFERWCASPFRNVGVKPFTAALLWSVTEGNGKTIIGQTLGALHGKTDPKRNYILIGEDELDSSFTEWAKGKTFIHADEVTGSDSRARQNKFKALITQEETRINEKGIAAVRVPDVSVWYFTSNSPNALYLGNKDRRFFVWEIEGSLPQDFFLETYDAWLHGDGPSHLMHHFMNLDMGDFHPHAKAYMTRSKMDMIEDSKGALGNWVARLAHGDEDVCVIDDMPDFMTAKRLFEICKIELDLVDDKTTTNTFGHMLRRAGFPRFRKNPDNPLLDKLYIIKNCDYWYLKQDTTQGVEEIISHHMNKSR